MNYRKLVEDLVKVNKLNISYDNCLINVKQYHKNMKQHRKDNNEDYDIYTIKELDELLKENLKKDKSIDLIGNVDLILEENDIKEAIKDKITKDFIEEVL